MTPDAATRPVRDRATLASYAQIGLYGWFLYAFGPSVTLLRDDQGTSSSVASLHGSLYAVGGILIALAAPRLGVTMGRGRSMRLGGSLIAVGLVVYCSGLPTSITFLGALLMGLAGGLVVVFNNAFLPAHQGPAAPAALSEATSISAVAGAIAPLAVGLGVTIGWGWRPGVLAAAVGFIVLEFLRGPLRAFDDGEAAERTRPDKVHLTARFWWSCVTLASMVAVEFCLVMWSSDLLRERAGTAPGTAALGVTAIVAGMAVGRASGSYLTRRVNTEVLLAGVLVLALVGTLFTWLVATTLLMFVGLFIAGLGVGLQWPLGIARVVRASGHHADLAVSRAAVLVGIASGLGPFVLAALADQIGVHMAFLVVPVFLIAALVMARAFPVAPDSLPDESAIDAF